jgi:hypothetical protein
VKNQVRLNGVVTSISGLVLLIAGLIQALRD